MKICRLSPPIPSKYQILTNGLFTFRESNDPRRSTPRAPPSNKEPKGPQLKEWYKTHETHEQLAVGKKTSRSFARTLGFLEEMEKKVNGHGDEAERSGH